jgi:hypothetical protein
MSIPKRITVGSKIYATHVYPELGSSKSAKAKMVDIVLSDDEALNLARHLVQAARVAKEITVAGTRKPSVKSKKHHVAVTYEPRRKK